MRACYKLTLLSKSVSFLRRLRPLEGAHVYVCTPNECLHQGWHSSCPAIVRGSYTSLSRVRVLLGRERHGLVQSHRDAASRGRWGLTEAGLNASLNFAYTEFSEVQCSPGPTPIGIRPSDRGYMQPLFACFLSSFTQVFHGPARATPKL